MVGVEARGRVGPVADRLDGDAPVLTPGDAQVVAGHDAIPRADAFGGGVEGSVDQANADESGVTEDEAEEKVLEAAVEHRTFNIEHRTSKEIQCIGSQGWW